MTESISYRLKDEEVPKHWDKSMDKIIEVNLRRIAASQATALSKASFNELNSASLLVPWPNSTRLRTAIWFPSNKT